MRDYIDKKDLKVGKGLKFLYETKFGGFVLRFITARWISKVTGWFLNRKISCALISGYAKRNKIDRSLYIDEKYGCFNDFFTRRIRPELREVSPDGFVSPCDGKLSVYRIDETNKFPVKGYEYTVEELLKNGQIAEKYKGGLCLVFRLCVDDYHRYIYIDNGTKGDNTFIKGELHTVQPIALENRKVFVKNCREYSVLDTEHFGSVTQVEVGAMMVGKIKNLHGAHSFARGEEKGMFEFGGSTIVLLVEKDRVSLDEEFFENTALGRETLVKCGEKIGN